MAEGSEQQIMGACKRRLRSEMPQPQGLGPNSIAVSGVVLGMYEFFTSNTDGTPKPGTIYLANKEDRVNIVRGKGSGDKGCIEFPHLRGAMFWICETEDRDSFVEMVRQTLDLKHHGLLKTYFTVYNDQLTKMVSACGSTYKTLQSWLADIPIKSRTAYFSDQEKELLLTLWDCVEYIWEKGFTSDELANVNSYRMIGNRIKIRTLVLRPRTAEEIDFLPLKRDLATLLEANFVLKWPDIEFQDFISFLRDPNSSTTSIHGYPIFCPPTRRQCMYRSLSELNMSTQQVEYLQERVLLNPWWTRTITGDPYFVLDEIFISEGIKSNDVDQALRLARYASAHYVQHLKSLTGSNWQYYMERDTIDRYLKECLPGLLTKRYALEYDPNFQALA